MDTSPITEPRQPAPLLREILAPTDLSDPSDAVLSQAALLAARFGSRLTLYHALEFPDHDEPHWAFAQRTSIWNEAERVARDRLASRADGLAVPHLEVVERAASPVRALVARMNATAPDLTVMATQFRGPFAHALIGSVAEEAVTHSRTPVLCVRGDATLDRVMARRIVLVSDLLEGDRAALRLAMLLASAFGGEVVMMHLPTTRDDEPWRAYTAVERWLEPLPRGVTMRVVMATSGGLTGVLRVASRENAGLVVVPRRGRDARKAARVVRHAHCSVLVA